MIDKDLSLPTLGKALSDEKEIQHCNDSTLVYTENTGVYGLVGHYIELKNKEENTYLHIFVEPEKEPETDDIVFSVLIFDEIVTNNKSNLSELENLKKAIGGNTIAMEMCGHYEKAKIPSQSPEDEKLIKKYDLHLLLEN